MTKEMLLKDVKEINYIEKLFQFFISDQKDVEYGKATYQIYQKLGWHQNTYFDVINSFWTTFSFAMHSKFPNIYPIAKAGKNVKIYKKHHNKYNSFPEKYFKENSCERKHVNEVCKEFPDINTLAKLCHCVANFMPCPKGFNSPKGFLNDVKDYFPLMIDKIQECVDNGMDITLNNNSISNKTIKIWHNFFLENQEKYYLNMYYNVNNNRIEGIPFFSGQSLSSPCPQEYNQINECLMNIIECINCRANLISSHSAESKQI